MVSRGYFFVLACASVLMCNLWQAIERVADEIGRLVLHGLQLFQPAAPVLAGANFVAYHPPGHALDAALQNELRHESRVSKRSADRNI